MEKKHQANFRLPDFVLQKLARLAQTWGVSKTSVITALIAEAKAGKRVA